MSRESRPRKSEVPQEELANRIESILEEKNKAKLTSSMQQGYNVVLVLNKEEIIWQLPNFG